MVKVRMSQSIEVALQGILQCAMSEEKLHNITENQAQTKKLIAPLCPDANAACPERH